MKTTNDKTLIRERVNRLKILIKEYELIKLRSHADFKFVQQWALARKINKKVFLKYYNRFRNTNEVENLLPLRRGPKVRNFLSEEQVNRYKESVFLILHSPPGLYGFNRTSWQVIDILKALESKGVIINKNSLRAIIKSEGYKFKKARKVLTSNDPNYKEKINEIKNILSKLNEKEKFFSIDEFGPLAIIMQPGRLLLLPHEQNVIPQNQKSKGSLIVTAALELSSNQITHFYSLKKNTEEMIKLIDILSSKYSKEEKIYVSWDAASWHNSKSLFDKIKTHNNLLKTPAIKIVTLPSNAQFLNVIESVFSGLAKSIIHNSNYKSVEECKTAIDLYFKKRNEFYKINPQRAGNKIWGKELVDPKFSESNNCKDKNFMYS